MRRLLTLMVLATGLFAQAPNIVSRYPIQNALNVPLDAAITVTFDVDMNSATINDTTFVVHGGYTGKLSGNYSYDGPSQTATFTPDQPFKVGEQVSVTVTTGVESAEGEALVSAYVWSFSIEVINGSGEFENDEDIYYSNVLKAIAVGDVDGDEDMDLVLVSEGSYPLFVLSNDGIGHFTSLSTLIIGNGPAHINLGDLDNDGDLDLVVSHSNTPGILTVLMNDGNGVFIERSTDDLTNQLFSGVLGDINGDGDLDLIVSNGAVLMNDGSGNFTQSSTTGISGTPTLGDIDGDGDLDLVVSWTAPFKLDRFPAKLIHPFQAVC